MKFRPQRGSYRESMAEVREFHTKLSFVEYIIHWAENQLFTYVRPNEITTEFYANDIRNMWKTHVVIIGNNIIGFTDGPMEDLP